MAKNIDLMPHLTKNMPGTIQNALDSILDHMHKVDEEPEELKKKVKNN